MKQFMILFVVLGVIGGSVTTAEAESHSSTAATALAKLTASDGTASDRFGISVSVWGDIAVVGAPHEAVEGRPQEGAAYVFKWVDGTWIEQAKLTASDGAAADRFGTAVEVFRDTVVVGAFFGDVGVNPDQGAAYVFTRSGATWTEQAKLVASDGTAADNFGFDVDVFRDTVLVGAYWDDVDVDPDQGSAYVFTRAGSTWTEQAKLTASDGAMRDEFGGRLALEGGTAVVGGGDGVYVFTRAGGTWTERTKLTASDGAAADLFGRSVTVSGDTIVVGAQYDDIGANADQGSAYVFTRTRRTWIEEAKLTAPDGGPSDLFGVSVAAWRGRAVIGAGFHDASGNTEQGAAYMWGGATTTTGS